MKTPIVLTHNQLCGIIIAAWLIGGGLILIGWTYANHLIWC